MGVPLLVHVLCLGLLLSETPLICSSPNSSSFSLPSILRPGSSLSVENKDDFLISPNGIYSAGFYSVGENAYCFSVWYTKPLSDKSHTVVWMANRDVPVNGKRSKLSLLTTGNLVLRDADQPLPIWTTTMRDSTKSAELKMNNSGNLYLQTRDNQIIWQSFGSPTDTLLPNQQLTKDTPLVSSRSPTNYSTGFYKLFFDNDNVIRLLFNGPRRTGIYWPSPEKRAWESGRSTYGDRRIATLDVSDWSYGCEPEFKATLCGNGEDKFVHFPYIDFYGYDVKYLPNVTLDACKQECRNICNCKGFKYQYDASQGFFLCYPKFRLRNGLSTLSSNSSMYLKGSYLKCNEKLRIQLGRAYDKNPEKESVKSLMIVTYVVGALEIIFVIYFFYRTRNPLNKRQGYLQAATGFQRFSYAELKKASGNFSTEIGRGGDGIVYKGILSDNRVAAIKHIKEFSNNQGEAELLAEISTLGRLNHMNLIKMWGYCAERKHRLLVYEYMENGSLAQKLHSNMLDWGKRFDIAVGTAKGLAYLHEECLEWVLHCDVKPHNILLDGNCKPKVADFGLCKLLDRDGTRNTEFTKARGTRGYMAPEWLFLNRPITFKVDVYSYGIVMLEMITGRSPADEQSEVSEARLYRWVTKTMKEASGKYDWIEEVVDSTVDGEYDINKMKILINVALRCSEEDMDSRPTMTQVVHMLLHVEEGDDY
nr:putative receptor protein kinase ZmPK1 [Tanacetum cinerariifolium]